MKIFCEFYKSKYDKIHIQLRWIVQCLSVYLLSQDVSYDSQNYKTGKSEPNTYTLTYTHTRTQKSSNKLFYWLLFYVYILLLQVSNCSQMYGRPIQFELHIKSILIELS